MSIIIPKKCIPNTLSFYRPQNVLCQSKFFEPAQKFEYRLVPPQKLLGRHRNQFYWMQIIFLSGTKIWTSPEYVGTCKGTRHKCELGYSILKGFWIHGIRYSELSFFRHFVRSLYFCMNSMISSRLDGGFKLNFSSFAKISYRYIVCIKKHI